MQSINYIVVRAITQYRDAHRGGSIVDTFTPLANGRVLHRTVQCATWTFVSRELSQDAAEKHIRDLRTKYVTTQSSHEVPVYTAQVQP